MLHGGNVRDAHLVFELAGNFPVEFKLFNEVSCNKHHVKDNLHSPWSAPLMNGYKLNTDTLVRRSQGKTGTGFVIRDYDGVVTATGSKIYKSVFSIDNAELMALRDGLLLALPLGIQLSQVECDALRILFTG